jgi:hypothetical protein
MNSSEPDDLSVRDARPNTRPERIIRRDFVRSGELLEVSLQIRVPRYVSFEQAREWLRYHLGDGGSVSLDNPLLDFKPETFGARGFACRSLDAIGHEEIGQRERTVDGGFRMEVHRWREPILPSDGATRQDDAQPNNGMNNNPTQEPK